MYTVYLRTFTTLVIGVICTNLANHGAPVIHPKHVKKQRFCTYDWPCIVIYRVHQGPIELMCCKDVMAAKK